MNRYSALAFIFIIFSSTSVFAEGGGFDYYFYDNSHQNESPQQRQARLLKEHLEYKKNHCKTADGDFIKLFSEARKKVKESTAQQTSKALDAIYVLEQLIKNCDLDLKKFHVSTADIQALSNDVYEKSLEPLVKKIDLLSDYRSVLDDLSQYKSLAEKSGVSKEEIDSNIKKWSQKSYRLLYEKEVQRLDLKSQYVDVEQDLKNFMSYGDKLGVNHHEMKTKINHWLVEGAKSVKREKAACGGKIDLRNDTLGPVRDQGDIGWCYAVALADTLTYKLGVKVSAADIAVHFYDQWLPNLLKQFGAGECDMFFGVDAWALSHLRDAGGACLESKFKSEHIDYAGGSIETTLRDIDTIKRYRLFEKNPTCENLKHYSPPIKALFPGLDQIDEYLLNSSREDLIRDMADAACEKRIDLTQIKSHFQPGLTESLNKKAIAVIDEQLGKKNILSISYNCDIHQHEPMQKIGLHAGTIVGRRYNESKQRCEYLVRGTWGNSSNYGTWEIDHGNFWLPKWALMMSLLGVNYLD